ncbi:MAG: hypothetical protein CMJ31_13310 [Phycisphaerae bacterium]|nr:hypothetical protein [Phycisphaerae bacterium]
MDYRVISIGAMAANDLWNEREPQRTGHATTTLIETTGDDDDGKPLRILVDPGLPEPAIVARLRERANLGPESITHVFLTCFRPDARRGIGAFDRARWLISNREREAVGVPLAEGLRRLSENFEEPDETIERVLRTDVAILQRCEPAPDRIGKGVDLFPLSGVTPGMTGLLVSGAQTTLVCGDAIPTAEHLAKGRAPRNCDDPDAAIESVREAVEIADLLVLGRDNVVVNPTKRPF